MRRSLVAALCLVTAMALAPAATAGQYHIVNGQPAADGAYPWMAAFLFDGGQGCGGSVVAENWILTAAHCVADDRGQPSVTPQSASFRVNTTNWTDGSGETLTAAEIIIHPNYDALITSNDIALIRTNETTAVTPVRIAGPGDLALNDEPTQARVIGYGTVGTGQPASDILLQVDVPVVSDETCRNQGYPQLVDETMVCAGSPSQDSNAPGDDSCQGDSGGPLFVDGPEPVQFGIVSFGGECGVGGPGVYSQVTTYTDWINGIIGGGIQPGEPDPGPGGDQPTGAEANPIRVFGGDGNDPVANAIAMSQLVFQTNATFGVLAASGDFPDALGGSALASYYGPLLYVDDAGNLPESTLLEFQRVLAPGDTVYVLGGTAVVAPEVDQVLAAAGFNPVRLAGAGRQQTAARVADEVNAVVNGGLTPPFDSVILAYEGFWADAVAVGQISAWFGIPVLLTPTDNLGGPARAYLEANLPSNVLVLGGSAVIADTTREEIAAITGPDSLIELAGAGRHQTSADITLFNRYELFPQNGDIFEFEGEPINAPDVIVVANLRQEKAFTHVLAASTIVGNFGGVFATIDGDAPVAQEVLDSVCAMDVEVLALGQADLVTDAAIAQVQAASAGTGCTAG